MTNKYLLFNVWDEPYRNATIWYCFAENEHSETRETDWHPIYNNDPRFAPLKSVADLLRAKTEYHAFKRYALPIEEFEAIVGET